MVPEFNRVTGNVLVPVVYLVTFVTSLVFRRPNLENPTLIDAQGEQAQRDAERAARRTQEFLEQIQRQAYREEASPTLTVAAVATSLHAVMYLPASA